MQKSSQTAQVAQAAHAVSARMAVVHTLLAIGQGQSLSQCLEPMLASLAHSDSERGFAHALLLTTLRHWHALARLLDTLADKPIDEVEVRSILIMGLTQLLYLQVKSHAAIHETVEVCRGLGVERATGLVNAILRKVDKNTPKYRKKCDKNHSLPNWLAATLKQDWREQYPDLTQALRQEPVLWLRVNTAQYSAAEYLSLLQTEGIEASIGYLDFAVNAQQGQIQPIRLNQPVRVPELPGFAAGAVSVQDAHAQLAAALIHQAQTQQPLAVVSDTPIRVLDACAAPGGKLLHWLALRQDRAGSAYPNKPDELSDTQAQIKCGSQRDTDALFHVKQDTATVCEQARAEVWAIDNEPTRIRRIEENLQRMQQQGQANLLCVDARHWCLSEHLNLAEPQQFDAILLDAPCTATGVLRRHPDIALLRQETDVAKTVALQAEILHNLWTQLKVGGHLLYVTCSILKAENEAQMLTFMARHADAKEVVIKADWGIAQAVGRQCLPTLRQATSVWSSPDASAMADTWTDTSSHTEHTESISLPDATADTLSNADIEVDVEVDGDGFYFALLTKTAAMTPTGI